MMSFLDRLFGMPQAGPKLFCTHCGQPLRPYQFKVRFNASTGQPLQEFGMVCPDADCYGSTPDIGKHSP